MFDTVFIPVLIVAVIGIIAATILSIASKFMAVPVDEKVIKLRDVLPGANCGACGCAGCDEYAQKLAKGECAANLCIPGGKNVAIELSGILGTEVGAVEEKSAYVKCNGTYEAAKLSMAYAGKKTCKECATFFGGNKVCSSACIGLGDCVNACEYNAIQVINGVAVVDKDNCVGCGACVKACPKNVIEMGPKKRDVHVACSNTEKGGVARKQCTNTCIGCMKCEKECPVDAIKVTNNLAYIDKSICVNCQKCVVVCPTGAILTYKKLVKK